MVDETLTFKLQEIPAKQINHQIQTDFVLKPGFKCKKAWVYRAKVKPKPTVRLSILYINLSTLIFRENIERSPFNG